MTLLIARRRGTIGWGKVRTRAIVEQELDRFGGYRSLRSEQWLTYLSLTVTSIAFALFLRDVWSATSLRLSIETWVTVGVYLTVIFFIIYGNAAYQLTRLAHLDRLANHRPVEPEKDERIYDHDAPPVAILIPSYKEELTVVRRTLLSAALQDYPNRRIALLIDDPPHEIDQDALALILTMRDLAKSLDAWLEGAARDFIKERRRFRARLEGGDLSPSAEALVIASLYEAASVRLDELANATPILDHSDEFFLEKIVRASGIAHRERANEWRVQAHAGKRLDLQILRREFERLAALFDVRITTFERKRFANLSHDANKAMNLNAYIGLLGQSFVEKKVGGEVFLVSAPTAEASLIVPNATFLVTLDADSLLLPEYVLRLVNVLEQPGNERIAVIQTPYSAIPRPKSELERVAGATTDIQYLIHQGFTRHGATYWVGANAVLRHSALHDIVEHDEVRGYPIRRFIQDRTVIEDTESTVDLIDKGWTLYNFPERLAYSATPPDFGSLTIQRGRWANGGLIILPKLLRYMLKGPGRLRKLREGFFRVHYLTSITGVNLGLLLLLLLKFPDYLSSWWLPLTAVPYYGLYARDLWVVGYRKPHEIVKVYTLNLLLLPVNLGGVMRSLHQGIARHKIPFVRTPKVAGRTRTPVRYLLALAAITLLCFTNCVLNLAEQEWVPAGFSFLHALLFSYGILIFIGVREALSDVAACLPRSKYRRRTA